MYSEDDSFPNSPNTEQDSSSNQGSVQSLTDKEKIINNTSITQRERKPSGPAKGPKSKQNPKGNNTDPTLDLPCPDDAQENKKIIAEIVPVQENLKEDVPLKKNQIGEIHETSYDNVLPLCDAIDTPSLIKNNDESIDLKSIEDNINYLGSSIALISYINNSCKIPDSRFITSVEIAFISAALSKFDNEIDFYKYYEKFHQVIFDNDKEAKDIGLLIFNHLTGIREFKIPSDLMSPDSLIDKALAGITQVKKGVKPLDVVCSLIKENEFGNSINSARNHLTNLNINKFSQLNDVADYTIDLIKKESGSNLQDEYNKVILISYITILRNASLKPENLIQDLFNNGKIIDEFHVNLIGLFFVKLFYTEPDWKKIGLKFLDLKKMKVLQPCSEVFYKPGLTTSKKIASEKKQKAFWRYINGKSEPLYKDPKICREKEVVETEDSLKKTYEIISKESINYGDLIEITKKASILKFELSLGQTYRDKKG
ncbi:MAG: hypothetical protein WCJ01_00945 [Ignavibacteria bacterium]